MKKKRIIILTIIGIIILIGGLLFMTTQQPAVKKTNPTPTPTSDNSFPPSYSPPTNISPTTKTSPTSQPLSPTPLENPASSGTGANKDEVFPKTETDSANQSFSLRSKTPIIQPNFRIDTDYKTLTFIITLTQPIEENKKVFKQWLQTNGYENIKEENFFYKVE